MSTSNKTVYVGVILAGLLDSLALGIIMPILPFIALDLGANAFWIGALFAVQFVGGALGSPILGRLADVVPRGALLIISLVSIALGNWALLFASSIPMLILIRGFVGFMSSNLVILESIVADMTSDKERSAGLAKLRLGSTLGLIIGPAILATIGSLGLFSSTAPMLILAASVTSLVPIIIGVTVMERLRALHVKTTKKAPYSEVFKVFRSNPKVRDFALIKTLIAMCFGLIMGIGPVWAETAIGWTASDASRLMLTFGLSLFVIQIFIATNRVKWFVSMNALVLACLIVIPGMIFVIFSSSAVSLVVLCCTIGLSSAIVNITVPSEISKVSYGNVGAMLGLMSTTVLIGSTLGPLVFGYVYDHYGYVWSWVCGLVCAGFATYLATKHLNRPVKAESQPEVAA